MDRFKKKKSADLVAPEESVGETWPSLGISKVQIVSFEEEVVCAGASPPAFFWGTAVFFLDENLGKLKTQVGNIPKPFVQFLYYYFILVGSYEVL